MGQPRIRLRRARKKAGYTLEQLAYALGVDRSTVWRWEKGDMEPLPYKRPELSKVLGVTEEQLEELLWEGPAPAPTSSPTAAPHGHAGLRADLDVDEWADDLDRASTHFGRQDFQMADHLVQRWLRRYSPDSADPVGQSLYGRSLRLQGDLRQDQGNLRGPLSASHSYRRAREVFQELKVPRRTAQIDLQLAVIEEMAGAHHQAANLYKQLADDQRLSGRDRTRSLLWVGTALSKSGRAAESVQFIEPAIRSFEELEEPLDWSVAHQKLALARRSAGDLQAAANAIDIALLTRSKDTPMQQVRLDTVQGHILLSDAQTAASGIKLLERAALVAGRCGMMHQLESIRSIRLAFEGQVPS
ncbi:helix-turn-helix transcriptional regulator [Amycolatopsis sp. PS_44_ISF1]|uniref:helix-turn-helix domain-containing protein n=1 Tax=Amycolatopsis sp. PS_44_ISF1 TaxID=2974917 RepID=UPI0028E03B74|nr:helix-turn-helix transcriptional regulator [Amycolatopsis sp. PS_44_ISF1]MDT8916021.1 helix-turn-helix domain-containing protein [Amycolatopsis sp. PS_44_ISF1]